jgi:TetR/AcrR family transcriptional regulator
MKSTSPPPAARKPAAAATPVKRRRGRPRSTHAVASRDTIIAAARQLLDDGLPHRATMSSISRKAGVDPALLRYYFGGRDQLLLAVVEDIIDSWNASHPAPAASPAARLGAQVGDMLDFSLKVRSMQRLMIDECARSRSPEVRRRVREINAAFVDKLALLLQPAGKTVEGTDALFLYVSIVGLCEFFAASQAMILPLAPPGSGADALAAGYRKFIVQLVLDGMRARVEPPARRARSRKA